MPSLDVGNDGERRVENPASSPGPATSRDGRSAASACGPSTAPACTPSGRCPQARLGCSAWSTTARLSAPGPALLVAPRRRGHGERSRRPAAHRRGHGAGGRVRGPPDRARSGAAPSSGGAGPPPLPATSSSCSTAPSAGPTRWPAAKRTARAPSNCGSSGWSTRRPTPASGPTAGASWWARRTGPPGRRRGHRRPQDRPAAEWPQPLQRERLGPTCLTLSHGLSSEPIARTPLPNDAGRRVSYSFAFRGIV